MSATFYYRSHVDALDYAKRNNRPSEIIAYDPDGRWELDAWREASWQRRDHTALRLAYDYPQGFVLVAVNADHPIIREWVHRA